ncbi:MAG TPA: hypothetical protein GXZ63_04055 [Mollicutes bacterium]|jgi:hypothetical protein|nr:hypothetical protein [Mollicutes bacterium]
MLFDRQFGLGSQQNMPMGFGMPGQTCPPIIEPTMTQCVEREFFHEVPQECSKSDNT